MNTSCANAGSSNADPCEAGGSGIDRLIAIMARLRNPDGGCPWDLDQDFSTIAPYTIEEAYEVADAIARGDMNDLKGELGDLLLQVVFHARMAEEADHFAFDDVAHAIADKMIRRHPHVFADGTAATPGAVNATWEEIKAAERAAKAKGQSTQAPESILDDVPVTLPALLRTAKLIKRVTRVGFDWGSPGEALDKVGEELDEVRAELTPQADEAAAARLAEEMGDLLFTVANAACRLGLDPEATLTAANRKFERRFRAVESRLAAQGRSLDDADLAEMDAAWDAVKAAEKAIKAP